MSDPVSSITAATPLPAVATPAPIAAPVAVASSSSSSSSPSSVPAASVPADLHTVAEALSKAFQPAQTDLHFQVDKITGQMVISVIDTQDGKTLLQIPGEEALAIAQSLQQMQANLLQRRA
jgi:flagellar protein FlaG